MLEFAMMAQPAVLPHRLILLRLPVSHFFSELTVKMVLYHDLGDKTTFLAISEHNEEVLF